MRNLLPWSQMGARKHRSTATALSLLTSTVHTVWKRCPEYTASMLSLDLSGAFDKVSHERLIWTLQTKGVPEWMRNFIWGFLAERITRLSFDGFTSDPIPMCTGIPQGSPLSPILFLVFASGLLEQIEGENGAVGLGFVDDTNIIVWGRSAEENCRRLDQIHERCLAWARWHGAAFAPKKYKLIHFTRRKKADITARTNIQGFDGKPVSSLRVLGV